MIYLEWQNIWPFVNKKSSFFRGDSPFFLHFQYTYSKNVGHFYCNSQYSGTFLRDCWRASQWMGGAYPASVKPNPSPEHNFGYHNIGPSTAFSVRINPPF